MLEEKIRMKKIRVGITSGLLPDNSGRFLEYWKIVLNEDKEHL